MAGDPFFLSITVYLALALLVAAVMIIGPSLLGERHQRKSFRRGERGTADPYESGIDPTGTAKLRVPLQYYLIAMLFVIFDLEAVYLYGWALVAREAGWLGLAEVTVFIAILIAALMYLWRMGALDWRSQRRRLEARPRPRVTKEDSRAMVA
jgi:NADH-quinone oxidoreductase subunit A